ncbi:hypothetical protein B0H16DRAFT_1464275 [Mycena metata]|uniref:Uncharacterized protein n=1 Tax=Mycena metata TaxID=1033252 RepID=A0AAD7IFD6_9AGAR|nr:hypothetical protein B0H16DRAFT_1464275 [Mycena metata]
MPIEVKVAGGGANGCVHTTSTASEKKLSRVIESVSATRHRRGYRQIIKPAWARNGAVVELALGTQPSRTSTQEATVTGNGSPVALPIFWRVTVTVGQRECRGPPAVASLHLGTVNEITAIPQDRGPDTVQWQGSMRSGGGAQTLKKRGRRVAVRESHRTYGLWPYLRRISANLLKICREAPSRFLVGSNQQLALQLLTWALRAIAGAWQYESGLRPLWFNITI